MKPFYPTKAVVLAAGWGTRLRPLTCACPKPLLPLWGRPLLEHTFTLLKGWGVRDVTVNLHHAPGVLLDWIRRNPVSGLAVNLSFEPDILGTGGALTRAQWFLDDRPFWLINADVAAVLDPAPLIRTFAGAQPLAVLWMEPTKGPRTVEMRDGLVTCLTSRRPGAEGAWTFTGLHLTTRRILDYLPPEGFAGIIAAYVRAMRKGETIRGVGIPGSYWADLGTPEQYRDAHRDVRRLFEQRLPGGELYDPAMESCFPGGVRVEGFAAVGRHVSLRSGVRLHDVVIGDHSVVESRADLADLVAGEGVILRGRMRNVAVRAETVLSPVEQVVLERMGFSIPDASVQTLEARGSDRVFLRVADARHSAIRVQYGTAREENRLYADHAVLLEEIGFSVPRVWAHDPVNRTMLMEDAGDVSLASVCATWPKRKRLALYRKVLDGVVRLHTTGASVVRRRRWKLMPPFTPALYRWEREYFLEHFAVRRCRATPVTVSQLRRELLGVAKRLSGESPVLIHRDLQSSNILLRRGRPVFIDFQGMRSGAASYDLASLLCDPYVMLPPDEQEALIEYYARRARNPAIYDRFWWAAVQRLAQALGAFARLSGLDGMEAFAGHIDPALRMMNRALVHLPAKFPELSSLCLSSGRRVLERSGV